MVGSKGVVIRSPVREEALAIQELIADGRSRTFGMSVEYLREHRERMISGPQLAECQKDIAATLEGDNTRLFRVAEAAGKIVGTLLSWYKQRSDFETCMPYPPEGTDTVCELGSLYIHPDWQGRGIGSLLMDEHHDWADQYPQSPSGLVVVTNNQPAIGFYDRHGYTIRGGAFRWMNRPLDQESVDCYWMQQELLSTDTLMLTR